MLLLFTTLCSIPICCLIGGGCRSGALIRSATLLIGRVRLAFFTVSTFCRTLTRLVSSRGQADVILLYVVRNGQDIAGVASLRIA